MQLNGCAPNCRSLLKNNDEELERKIRQDHLYRDRHKCEPERLSAPTMSENFHLEILDGILDTDAPAFPHLDARNPNWEYTGPPPKTPGPGVLGTLGSSRKQHGHLTAPALRSLGAFSKSCARIAASTFKAESDQWNSCSDKDARNAAHRTSFQEPIQQQCSQRW